MSAMTAPYDLYDMKFYRFDSNDAAALCSTENPEVMHHVKTAIARICSVSSSSCRPEIYSSP